MSGTIKGALLDELQKEAEERLKMEKEIKNRIVALKEENSEKVNVINFAKKWKKAKDQERKAVFSVLVDKIYIHEDGTPEIVWNI